MARAGRKPSAKTLDDKIIKQQEVLGKSKIKYERDKVELAQLLKLRNELCKIWMIFFSDIDLNLI